MKKVITILVIIIIIFSVMMIFKTNQSKLVVDKKE